MKIMCDDTEIYILPDCAYCEIDDEKRNPLDINECPIGCDVCSGDCYYYREDEERSFNNETSFI